MKFNYSYLNQGAVVKCGKCIKGTKPNGKVCKYCNGTGVITKKNQSY